MISILAGLLIAGASVGVPLQRIQAKVATELVTLSTPADWAGRYVSPPPGTGGLSGSDLYLFPDGNYIYCEWADIEPLTIYDKGAWVMADGLLRLHSDADITWPPGAEREFVSVRRLQHPPEVLLVGTGRTLEFLEAYNEGDPALTLLFSALVRERRLSIRESKSIRRALMKESWHPERLAPGGSH